MSCCGTLSPFCHEFPVGGWTNLLETFYISSTFHHLWSSCIIVHHVSPSCIIFHHLASLFTMFHSQKCHCNPWLCFNMFHDFCSHLPWDLQARWPRDESMCCCWGSNFQWPHRTVGPSFWKPTTDGWRIPICWWFREIQNNHHKDQPFTEVNLPVPVPWILRGYLFPDPEFTKVKVDEGWPWRVKRPDQWPKEPTMSPPPPPPQPPRPPPPPPRLLLLLLPLLVLLRRLLSAMYCTMYQDQVQACISKISEKVQSFATVPAAL